MLIYPNIFLNHLKFKHLNQKTTSYPITVNNDTTQIVINNKETPTILVENGIKIVSIYQCDRQ